MAAPVPSPLESHRMRARRAPARATGLVAGAAVAALALTGVVPASAATQAPPDGPAAPAVRADLRADVDRDGTVDVSGRSDERRERRWSQARGAVVLPNIDDDTDRCSPTVALCNDATDQHVNGTADALDLARLHTVPVPAAPAGSTATVVASGHNARLFVHRGDSWARLAAGDKLSTAEVRAGVELGIEATDVIRDASVWDGTIRVTLELDHDGAVSRDRVRMRVAPVLTHHPVQAAEQVVVTNSAFGAQKQFVADLAGDVADAGIAAPLIKLPQSDIWTQDFFEPAYTSITGADGDAHVLRVMIRSHQPRSAGSQVFSELRGPDVGAIELTQSVGWETLNSFGNLETIPPYKTDERSYPAGRIIMGRRGETGTAPSLPMRTLLTSQGFQEPLLLDTSWLYVGHVDEFVQFLPDDSARGWTIGVSDPVGGLDLLRAARADGHGSSRLFSLPGGPSQTITQTLDDATFVADNEMAAGIIEDNLDLLLAETGVRRADVVRVPGLYSRDPAGLFRPIGGRVPLQDPSLEGTVPDLEADAADVMTAAQIPGAVNGVILSADTYLAPKQWGPVVDGEDIFAAAVEDAYAEVGMEVTFLDDWYSHHGGLGEVHCGTNTFRDATAPWWRLR